MFLTRLALKNPVAVTLFFGCVTLIGLTAWVKMGRSILPPVSLPIVSVRAAYPGAGPTEIERLVVEPLEDQFDLIPDVDRVFASAQNGVAAMTVRFRFGSDLDVDRSNVQQAVDSARPNMPADLIPPAVSKDDPTQAPILEESIGSAVIAPGALADLVERGVVPALRATSGIGTVLTSGERTRQFIIRPNLGALNAVNGTALDLFRALSTGNAILPGGLFKSPAQESTIGIRAAATSKEELEELPVAIPGGPSVRLADLAAVEDGFADQTAMTRVDGDPSIVLYVSRAPGADSIRAIAATRATFARLARRYPLVRFEQLRSDGPYTTAAVNGVLQTLGEGIVLTILVMLLFLHAWRNALIAAISMPTSLCAAFVAMWAMGFTVNVLSLMGLSLTIGILVDDSIVIIEAITRNAARGLKAEEAALAGRRELGAAAFAITMVDVAVFAPIALTSGVVGEFMREFGLVIVFATTFSLLASFTLTPLLAARWAVRHAGRSLEGLGYASIASDLQGRARLFPWTFRTRIGLSILASWHAAINAFNAWERRASAIYADRWLPAVTRRRSVILLAVAGICTLSLVPFAFGAIPVEFSPPVNRGDVRLDLALPAGTPLAQTDAAAQRLTNTLLDDDAVAHVVVNVGREFNGTTDIAAPNVAELSVVLTDPGATGDALVARVKSLAYLVPNASIAGAGKGMGGVAPISYSVAGDPDRIDAAAARIADVLRANPLASDVRTSDAGLEPKMQIEIDPVKARLLNVSLDDAAQTARIATGGSIATKARLSSGLIDVVERFDAAETGDLDRLRQVAIRGNDARLIPLGDVSTFSRQREPTVIERENRARIVTVSANTLDGAPIGLVATPTSRTIRSGFLPQGTRIEPRGEVEQFLDAATKLLTALALSLVVVYAILAILYRSYVLPFVIMLTVPLAAVGAFGTLFVLNVLAGAFPGTAWLQGQTLNLYSMLGIVMLVGLVAKNGILLVEYAERAVREGADATKAMRDAAKRRLRPILMTTCAMIAGMLPLALGQTIGAEYRKALGSVVIGGLSSSLLLTLFVVPIVYVAYRSRVGVAHHDQVVSAA